MGGEQVQHLAEAVSAQISAHTWAEDGYTALQQLTTRLAQSAAPEERQVAAAALISLGQAKAWRDDCMMALLGRLRQDADVAVSSAAYEHFCFQA